MFLRLLLATTPAVWLRLYLVHSVVLRKKKSFSLVLNICTAARTPIDKSGRLLKRSARARRIAPDKKWRPQQGSIYRKNFDKTGKVRQDCDESHVTKLVKSDKESVIMALCRRYNQGAQICVSAPARGYRSQWQVAATHTPPGGLG